MKCLLLALDTQSLMVSILTKFTTSTHKYISYLVSKTKVVIFGGATGDTGKYIITGDTYALDLVNSRWTKLEGK